MQLKSKFSSGNLNWRYENSFRVWLKKRKRGGWFGSLCERYLIYLYHKEKEKSTMNSKNVLHPLSKLSAIHSTRKKISAIYCYAFYFNMWPYIPSTNVLLNHQLAWWPYLWVRHNSFLFWLNSVKSLLLDFYRLQMLNQLSECY